MEIEEVLIPFEIKVHNCSDHTKVILYINDLPACSNKLEFILFAEDTSIFFEHSDLDVLTSHLNDQLNNVSTWLKANKLSIKFKKTKLMIFRPRQKTLPITRQIILENNVILNK